MAEESSGNRGAKNQQTARAGEYYVAAELNRRGAYAVTFAGNMPKIDIMASNLDQSRIVTIQVKTKRSGTWHASIDEGRPCEPRVPETAFWVFIDIGSSKKHPEFWIVPDWWIRNNIHKTHQDYLNRHGGKRARSPKSKHHAIDEKRIKQWKDKWGLLDVF